MPSRPPASVGRQQVVCIRIQNPVLLLYSSAAGGAPQEVMTATTPKGGKLTNQLARDISLTRSDVRGEYVSSRISRKMVEYNSIISRTHTGQVSQEGRWLPTQRFGMENAKLTGMREEP